MIEHSILDYLADWRVFAAALTLTVLIMCAGVIAAVLWMFRRGQ